MVSKQYKEEIRIFELDYLIRHLNGVRTLLELGAGAGWQARRIAEQGIEVSAIDVEQTTFRNVQVYNVQYYDGKTIPFSDKSFDAIFSSNVLEHIPHIDESLRELHRVLKDEGMAIHFVPNFSWRFWTSITHFPYVIKRVLGSFFSETTTSSDLEIESANSSRNSRNLLFRAANFILPLRHGERGNVFSEHYYFSRLFWKRKFENNNWHVESLHSIPLFHSGNYFMSDLISIKFRNVLGRLIGGTTDVYILRKK